MSTIKVDTITTLDGTGDITVSRPLSGSGASLTNLPAANLTGTLPALSGASLTNLPAGNLTGTIADARFPATLPAVSGANLTSLPSSAGNFKNGKIDLNLSTATGSLVVTGLGFTPTHLLINFAVSNERIAGWGMMGNTSYFVAAYEDFVNVFWRGGMEVRISGSQRQAVVLGSLDSDGFTLSHTKFGSPTGTAWIMWMALG